MLLRTMKISRRAGLGFALIALMALLLGSFSLLEMRRMNEQSRVVDRNWLPSILALNDTALSVSRIRTITLRLLTVRTDEDMRSNLERLTELKQQLQTQQHNYEQLISLDEEKVAYEGFQRAKALYMTEQEKLSALAQQGHQDQAIDVANGSLYEHADAMVKALIALIDLNKQGAKQASLESDTVFSNASELVLTMMIVAVLLTIVLAVVLTRSIVRPLSQAVSVAEVIASGDLCSEVTVVGSDEPAQLLHALKRM